jgi:Protein of unknown function (DUF2934)
MKSVKTTKPKAKKTVAVKTAARKAAPQAKAAKPARKTAPAVPAAEITSEQIARRAYFIWEQNGRQSGRDAENWALAEKQLKAEQAFAE